MLESHDLSMFIHGDRTVNWVGLMQSETLEVEDIKTSIKDKLFPKLPRMVSRLTRKLGFYCWEPSFSVDDAIL